MTLIKYYLEKNFNPVPVKTNNKKLFYKHVNLRKNLIESHLKIPLNLLKDKNILEFGPNRGEHSMIYALNGGNLYFVEPIFEAVNQLKKNYKKYNLDKAIKNIQNKNLEKYNSKKKFDLVIAEGFLNTLPNRDKYLKKIFNLVSDSGLVIINYDDYFGSFVELIKSAILKKICIKKCLKLDSKESLKISKKLFYEDFKKLKNTRPFEAYWLDQLSCEFAIDVWKFTDILNLASKNNFYFYSSSPIWSKISHYNWYKNLNLNKKKYINQQIYKEWKENFSYFLTGKKNIKIENKHEKNYQSFNILVKQVISFLKKDGKIRFKKIKTYENSFFKDINTIIDFLNDKKIKLNYKNLKTFRSFTGTNLHYVCLKKNEKNYK
tara:strand:+ start:2800 stop:3930 length:1131 start_codon:yes stop_codon:yes gene_type:complete